MTTRSKKQSDAVYEKAAEIAKADTELLMKLSAKREEPKPAPTLADNYFSSVGLIQQAKRETRLSETTLVRMWELTLMWALNNRQAPPPFLPMDDEQPELPEVHEIFSGEAE